MEHGVPVAIVPPASVTLADPAAAVVVPPHELFRPLGEAMRIPEGSVSVKVTPVSATVLAAGFVIVKLKVEIPAGAIPLGVNTLAIAGGATTVMLADAVPPAPPCVDVTLLVVLFCVPAAMPVTFTENVQEVLAAKVALLRLTTFVPCGAVMVPLPHVPVSPFGVATTKPAGKASVKPTPARAVVALLF